MPRGGALFQKGLCAFGFISGAAERAKEPGFAFKGHFQRKVESFIDGAKGFADSKRRVGGDLKRESLGAGHQFVGGKHLIHKADAKRILRGEDVAGEQDSEGCPATNKARKALGSAVACNHAKLHLRLAETCVFRRKTERAGHGKLTAAAKGEAADAGDGGLAEGFDGAKDGLAALREGFSLFGRESSNLANVGAGGEGARSSAGEQDGAYGVVGGEGAESGFQLSECGGVERIENAGPVERDLGQRRAEFDKKICGFHAEERVAGCTTPRTVATQQAMRAQKERATAFAVAPKVKSKPVKYRLSSGDKLRVNRQGFDVLGRSREGRLHRRVEPQQENASPGEQKQRTWVQIRSAAITVEVRVRHLKP